MPNRSLERASLGKHRFAAQLQRHASQMKHLLRIAVMPLLAIAVCAPCHASFTAKPRVVVCAHFVSSTNLLTDESILAVSQFTKRVERHPIGVGGLQIFLMYGADSNPRPEAEQRVLARRHIAATQALSKSWSGSSPFREHEVDVREWPATPATTIPALGECGAIFQADYWGEPEGSPCERAGYCYVICSPTSCRQK